MSVNITRMYLWIATEKRPGSRVDEIRMRRLREVNRILAECQQTYRVTKGTLDQIEPGIDETVLIDTNFFDQLMSTVLMHQSDVSKSRERATRVLDCWAAILPARIVNEELGDYIEDINERAALGQRWLLYLRIMSAIAWTGINAVGYALKVLGKKQAG